MLYEYEEDNSVLDKFTSDDGLHIVEWMRSEELGYETWICTTHNKPYYRDCVDSGGVFVIVEQ